jgi:spermidine/putrescine transport system ATP-binding protein
MEKITVRLENLCKKFGEVTAVDHINLDIKSGEFVTLLGPSGCGKTTTLRMIAGLEMPTSGAVYLEDQDYTRIPPEKRPVNMVFQAYALFPHLTRALINHPTVLLLDEPLGALDLKLRKAMQLELRAIQQRLGMTFVYVTHDQEEAMVMSDRIVLMNKGKIVQLGTPTEIYNHPANEFVSRFIGEANLLSGTVTGQSGDTFQIETGEQVVVAAPAKAGITVGDGVIVSVRPERITVFARAEEAPSGWANVFGGTVESAIFLGPITRYHVKLANSQLVIADKTAVDGQAEFRANEQVFVGWETANSVVLPV